ncbi:MAG: hypothetical protein ABL883_02465 [Terricaulis sp.]
MKIAAGVVSVLLAILVALSIPVAVLSFSAERELLTAEKYQAMFARERFYDQALKAMVEVARAGASDNMGALSDEELLAAMARIAPQAEVQTLFDQMTQAFIGYLRGESDRISISMADFKAGVIARAPDAIIGITEGKPACPGRWTGFQCRPKPAEIVELRQRLVQYYATSPPPFPDSMTYPETATDRLLAESQFPTERRRQVIAGMIYSPLAPGFFLLLITAFSVRSWRGLARWWGIPILVGGVLALITWSLLKIGVFASLSQARAAQVSPIETQSRDLGLYFGELIAQNFFTAVLPYAGLAAVLGLALTILSFVLKPPPRDAELTA